MTFHALFLLFAIGGARRFVAAVPGAEMTKMCLFARAQFLRRADVPPRHTLRRLAPRPRRSEHLPDRREQVAVLAPVLLPRLRRDVSPRRQPRELAVLSMGQERDSTVHTGCE